MTCRNLISILTVLLLTGTATNEVVAQTTCYDLSNHEPKSLSGQLSATIFAGPPNFEDVQKGDSPEPGYLLSLPHNICISGDEFADPAKEFNEVQLFASSEALERELKQKSGQNVLVILGDAFAAHTGHHHRPLVARVVSVSPAVTDQTEEYGSAASTVRAFYYALSQGNGDVASSYVVAEKRKKGPFSAVSLTSLYSSLEKPLELLSLKALDDRTYDVRYHFQSKAGFCDGHSVVKTVTRDGRNYIDRIKALNRC